MNKGWKTTKDKLRDFLEILGDEACEVSELFEQWARREKYRYEGEHKLAEERDRAQREYRNRLAYLRKKKFVRTKKSEGRLFVELSKEGKQELRRRTIKGLFPNTVFASLCPKCVYALFHKTSNSSAIRRFSQRRLDNILNK